ncbi:pyridoxamine 5'-phosphate oxidase family protein [Pedococcus soli]
MNDLDTSPAVPGAVPREGPGTAYATDHTGLRVLDLEDCLTRLGAAPVGRLAFPLDGEIAVLPVNHLLDGVDICFRTAGGSKIQAALDGDAVSFQVDEWDAAARSGWSVLVHGTAAVVTDEAEAARLVSLARRPWVRLDEREARWVRVSTRQVTGRMLLPG